MTEHAVVSWFLVDYLNTTQRVMWRLSDRRKPLPALNEVVESHMARYCTQHPHLFTADMLIKVELACWCGACENPGVIISYNTPLNNLLLKHGHTGRNG
jgi:hypothetical protein